MILAWMMGMMMATGDLHIQCCLEDVALCGEPFNEEAPLPVCDECLYLEREDDFCPVADSCMKYRCGEIGRNDGN